jgi:hypothetical protein
VKSVRLAVRFGGLSDLPEIPTTREGLIEAAKKLRFEAGVLAQDVHRHDEANLRFASAVASAI